MRSSSAICPRAVAAALALLLLASCSSGSKPAAGDGPTGGATSTAPVQTLVPAVAAKAYEQAGPNPVGVTTYTLPAGNKVEVWYPAVAGTTGTITYDARDYTPAFIKASLTSNIPATFSYPGRRDAKVAAGTYPVVLFSHGFAGFRVQSSFLTSHLASWGMIVASPEHPSRDLEHALEFKLGKAQDSIDDLAATLKLVTAENATPGSLLAGHVDTTHVAAVGHSAGGATVLGAARQIAAIDGYVSLASGIFRDSGRTATGASTTTSTTQPPMPDKPSLFVAGADDHVAVFADVTKPAFDTATPPTRLWLIGKLGHNGFDDVCTYGNGRGIIGVAEASGLGPLLSKPPFDQFKLLGQDGCLPPAAPVRQSWPIIEHVVTSWLRNLFGIDARPVGLGPEVAGQYGVSVQIEARAG
jgi:dienelactone hydrolase